MESGLQNPTWWSDAGWEMAPDGWLHNRSGQNNHFGIITGLGWQFMKLKLILPLPVAFANGSRMGKKLLAGT